MLSTYYGYWEFWEPYNPSYSIGPGAQAYGPQKVTFDGVNKLILINEGETSIDVRIDIYSNWKEWTSVRDNAKFDQAISAIGGDPITDTTNVGITYFLENGWRIRPYDGDYILDVNGNIYTREPGQDPVIPPTGDKANVTVNLTRSNLVDIVQTSGSALTTQEATMLNELWKLAGLGANPLVVTDTTRSVTGEGINQTITEDPPGTVTVERS